MDYTTSANLGTAANGQRKHTNASAPTTRVTDKDMNSVTWEIMEVIKAGVAAGAYPAALAFDETNPASYGQLKGAVQKLIATAISAQAPDRFAVGWSAYNAATNTLSLQMADGSTLPVDLTPAFADAVSGKVDKAGDTSVGDLFFTPGKSPNYGVNDGLCRLDGTFTKFDDVPKVSGHYWLPASPTLGVIDSPRPDFVGSGWFLERTATFFGFVHDEALFTYAPAPDDARRIIKYYRAGAVSNFSAASNNSWQPVAPVAGYLSKWVYFTSTKYAGVTYTNTTNVPINLSVVCSGQNNSIEIDGQQLSFFDQAAGGGNTMTCVVPCGSTYKVVSNLIFLWAELI